jgi:hypothetical protein
LAVDLPMNRGAKMKMTDIATAIEVGLTVVTHRLLTLVALLMTFGLFCVAMSQGTWVALTIAGAFGLIIFLPVLVADKRPEAKWQSEPAQ